MTVINPVVMAQKTLILYPIDMNFCIAYKVTRLANFALITPLLHK